ncbi:MAG: PAS domain-containing protein [Candidatus Kariarchaeaceae archaeon]|jgi:PAS domain S-box-containing protein
MTESIFEGNFPAKLSKQILDMLPYAISVQSKDRVVLFENKKMIELFGTKQGQLCYTRWNYLLDYEDKPCEACPGHATLIDKEEHSLFRKAITKHNEDIFLEITHIPVLNQEGDLIQYIEIIKDITTREMSRLTSLEYRSQQLLREEIKLSVIRFGDLGGELVVSDELDLIGEMHPNIFFMKMGAYWFTAIGQGHNWSEGLYGPLPVLDILDYDSIAYSFRLQSKKLEDPRLKGEDLLMLMILVHKDKTQYFSKRELISKFLSDYFNKFIEVEDLTDETLTELRNEFIPFLRDLGPKMN